jgi:hypothetical protein
MSIIEEVAFIFYQLSRWIHWFTLSILRLFRRRITFYFSIADDGTQTPLTDDIPKTLMVIYYTPTRTKYRMLTPEETDIEELKSAYSTYEEPTYSFLGLSVSIDDVEYEIPSDEFMVVGSLLFSPIFNLWLCKNYLHVTPSSNIVVTFIDDAVRMVAVTSEVFLHRDKYAVKRI